MPCPITADCRQSLLARLSVCDSGVIFTLAPLSGSHYPQLTLYGVTKATVSVTIFSDAVKMNICFRIQSISQVLRVVNTKKQADEINHRLAEIICLFRFCRKERCRRNRSEALFPQRERSFRYGRNNCFFCRRCFFRDYNRLCYSRLCLCCRSRLSR